eukprot:TRINITY_DN2606_c0_g1_i1.p1 TRINITY_DN2606_c0_g1~~TRINITY_DN2606_c0_g1_i1.p1  ORF type:complete len:598 (-),score=84.53 TRINITY_DN2606_c0_g1_i1:198-1991(-)
MPHKRRGKGAHQTKLLFQPETSFLYLQYYKNCDSTISVPLHTLIPIFVIKYIRGNNIKVFLYQSKETEDNPFHVNLKESSFEYEFCDQLPQNVARCRLPCWYLPDQLTCLAGLCSVVRYIIKLTHFSSDSEDSGKCIELLGHQYGCLSAPAEVSTWTKFCELDMPDACKQFFTSATPILPEELSKFEAHLKQPIRIHNVRKRMQKEKEKENLSPNSNGDIDPILSYAKANHIFAEGPDLLVSDIMLFPCIALMVQNQEMCFKDNFPLLMRWFDRVCESIEVKPLLDSLVEPLEVSGDFINVNPIKVPDESLYKCDPSRDANKTCTSQINVDKNFEWWENSGIESLQTYGCDGQDEKCLDWKELPKLIHPQAGNLPVDRLERKCEQLQGLALPIVELAKQRQAPVIVDFCSGGGHLGLLLAFLIPEATVHMVENKEESLARARERGIQLGLKNVWYFQSNIDYYKGSFDIGTSLHACGVATDLVIEKSRDQSADIVSCPCCYGAVQAVDGVSYPRSVLFAEKGCTEADYLTMGHTADQTEKHSTKCGQGELFMDIVDTDRCLHLQEHGYHVQLDKISPLTCSPKHNLIVAKYLAANGK